MRFTFQYDDVNQSGLWATLVQISGDGGAIQRCFNGPESGVRSMDGLIPSSNSGASVRVTDCRARTLV